MIREERDPAFWDGVASHPEVAPRICCGLPLVSLADVVQHPSVLPLATEHGGFLFCRLDGMARVWELHTLYTPEGWGREVLSASHEAFPRLFSLGAQLVTTYEVEGCWRSRPPLSQGWKPAGPFAKSTVAANLRTWVLTRDAYEASPVWRRICQSSRP